MRKYLDDIGVKRDIRPEGYRKGIKRRIKCWYERRIYGFDATETYSLDYTWYLWLYEHLKMYREYADKTVVLTEKNIEFDGDTLSQSDLIDMMLKRLEVLFDPSYDEFDKDQWEYVHQIEKIWAVVLPYMWW